MNINSIPTITRVFENLSKGNICSSDIETAIEKFTELYEAQDLRSVYEKWQALDCTIMAFLQQKIVSTTKKQASVVTFIQKATKQKPNLKQTEINKLCKLTKPTINKHAGLGKFTKHKNGSVDTASFLQWLKYSDPSRYTLFKNNWSVIMALSPVPAPNANQQLRSLLQSK